MLLRGRVLGFGLYIRLPEEGGGEVGGWRGAGRVAERVVENWEAGGELGGWRRSGGLEGRWEAGEELGNWEGGGELLLSATVASLSSRCQLLLPAPLCPESDSCLTALGAFLSEMLSERFVPLSLNSVVALLY